MAEIKRFFSQICHINILRIAIIVCIILGIIALFIKKLLTGILFFDAIIIVIIDNLIRLYEKDCEEIKNSSENNGYSIDKQGIAEINYGENGTIALSANNEINYEKTIVPDEREDFKYSPTECIYGEDIDISFDAEYDLKLIGKGGYFDNKSVDLKGAACFGRHPNKCNICYPLDEKGISSVHCMLKYNGEAYILSDLGSTYGTFTSKGKIEQNKSVRLQTGDIFWLADKTNAFIIR